MAKEILIYGNIGYDFWTGEGITAKSIMAQLAEIKNSKETDVTIRINSPGGSVFEGVAIYNMIASSDLNIETVIDGIAYSMGAIIALAGKKVKMAKNATMLLHNVSGGVWGNANDFRGALEMIEKLDNSIAISISDKTGMSVDDVKAKYMDFRDHTLSANEALNAKLIDEVLESTNLKNDFKDVADAVNFFNTASQKQFIKNEIKATINNQEENGFFY